MASRRDPPGDPAGSTDASQTAWLQAPLLRYWLRAIMRWVPADPDMARRSAGLLRGGAALAEGGCDHHARVLRALAELFEAATEARRRDAPLALVDTEPDERY